MEKDIRKYVRSVLNEFTAPTDIGLPLGLGDLESDKKYFDDLDEERQWFWALQNKAKIAYISLDEDRVVATFKGDESNFRKDIYSKYPLVFKSGGGYHPIPHILGNLGIKVEII